MSKSGPVTAVLGETPYVATLSDGTHEWSERRERLLQVANACPVNKTLGGEIRTSTTVV